MASNLQRAISANQLYVTINSKDNNVWRDFTLQPGHIYGFAPYFKKVRTGKGSGYLGTFVLKRYTSDKVEVYLARKNPAYDEYVRSWQHRRVNSVVWDLVTFRTIRDDRTLNAIREVVEKRVGGVRINRTDVRTVFNPPVSVSYKYLPMQNMRILGGSFGEVHTMYTRTTFHDKDHTCAAGIAYASVDYSIGRDGSVWLLNQEEFNKKMSELYGE